jgi:hypothetical protein
MKLILGAICAVCFTVQSFADDSSALYERRRKELANTDFWCETGRAPILNSLEALNVVPLRSCKFSGSLDTKISPRLLEPPFLNPLLRLNSLRDFVLKLGGSIESESANRVQMRLAGERYAATMISYKHLKDTYMRLGFYPAAWGTTFVSISGESSASIRKLVEAANTHAPSLFSWTNPQFQEETAVWPRMTSGPRPYMPVDLIPRCQVSNSWNPSSKAILLVGDTHTPRDTRYFLNLIQTLPMAFAELEISNDYEPVLKEFLEAKTAQEENPRLDKIVGRLPNEIKDDFREILRTLKRRQIQIILMDYHEAYLNFPFTSTASHGAVIAQRNKLWTDRLPSTWSGSGVILAGIDHFTEVPGSDLQNFLSERFPGVTLGLVNPYEECD